MKSIRFLAIALFTAAMLTACAPQETQNPASLSSPAEETAAPYDERLIYHSKDEFYSEVNKAKEDKEKSGNKTYYKIEEIEYYYDFKDPVKDVDLDSVNLKTSYVALLYCDKEARESGFLTLKCDRLLYESEEQYLQYYSVLQGLSETVINGHKALKGKEYWDDPFTTEIENVYTSNRYFWVENGTAIFLRIPAWLLERYPEETFFDIQKVKIKKIG